MFPYVPCKSLPSVKDLGRPPPTFASINAVDQIANLVPRYDEFRLVFEVRARRVSESVEP